VKVLIQTCFTDPLWI